MEAMMPFVIFVALAIWFLFGTPSKTVANWFWEYEAAPWEAVYAIYYPDRQDLSKQIGPHQTDDADGCLNWSRLQARRHDDPGFRRGDFMCYAGEPYDSNGFSVYRTKFR
jgi:hypothetical protein